MCVMLLIASSVFMPGQQEPTPARIIIRLPAAAALFIDGEESSQTGETRGVTTPPLEAGHTYYYRLVVAGKVGGEDYRLQRKVSFRPGETVVVTFRTPVVTRDAPARTAKTTAKAPPSPLSADERMLVELTNRERAEAGLPPLRPESRLATAAREHSANMARQQKMDHVLDDKGPTERVRDAGYDGFGWGENIAFGQQTPAQAIEVWMNSPGHRANILGEQYTHIGVGIVRDRRGIPYYTQVFGRNR